MGIMGRRGAEIKKIQQKFNVELKLPKDGDSNPDLVTIMGDEEGVADCKDHLLNIQEEYLQDELDRESVQQLAPSRIAQQEQDKKKGFESTSPTEQFTTTSDLEKLKFIRDSKEAIKTKNDQKKFHLQPINQCTKS